MLGHKKSLHHPHSAHPSQHLSVCPSMSDIKVLQPEPRSLVTLSGPGREVGHFHSIRVPFLAILSLWVQTSPPSQLTGLIKYSIHTTPAKILSLSSFCTSLMDNLHVYSHTGVYLLPPAHYSFSPNGHTQQAPWLFLCSDFSTLAIQDYTQLSSLRSFRGHYYPWLFNLHVPFVKCLGSDPRSHAVFSCLHLFRIPIASPSRTSQSESFSLTHLANIYQVPVRAVYLICSDFPATLRVFAVKAYETWENKVCFCL